MTCATVELAGLPAKLDIPVLMAAVGAGRSSGPSCLVVGSAWSQLGPLGGPASTCNQIELIAVPVAGCALHKRAAREPDA